MEYIRQNFLVEKAILPMIVSSLSLTTLLLLTFLRYIPYNEYNAQFTETRCNLSHQEVRGTCSRDECMIIGQTIRGINVTVVSDTSIDLCEEQISENQVRGYYTLNSTCGSNAVLELKDTTELEIIMVITLLASLPVVIIVPVLVFMIGMYITRCIQGMCGQKVYPIEPVAPEPSRYMQPPSYNEAT